MTSNRLSEIIENTVLKKWNFSGSIRHHIFARLSVVFTAILLAASLQTLTTSAFAQAGVPANITVISGGGQSANINTNFAQSVVIELTDSLGDPVSGFFLRLDSPASGASVGFSNGTNTLSAAVGLDGRVTLASSFFIANGTAGTYNVVVSLPGVGSPPPDASFTLTNTAEAAANISIVSGDGQAAMDGTAFSQPLVARVTDASGNPVANEPVTFIVNGADATFASSNTATESVLTDVLGNATSSTLTADTGVFALGDLTVEALLTGGLDSTDFALTIFGVPNSAQSSNSNQTATVNSVFANPLRVLVRDIRNNPVPNVEVTFIAPLSGPSATFASSGTNREVLTTDAAGIVDSSAITANGTAGSFFITISVANFTLRSRMTNETGPAATLVVTSGSGQSATINTAFAEPLVATLTDATGNPISGRDITFTLPTTGASGAFGGSLSSISVNTDANGRATTLPITANGIAGNYNVIASPDRLGGIADATFSLTNTGGVAANLVATSGGGQNAIINTAFAAPLVATVTDALGNPVSGTAVTFTAPGSGASGTFGNGTATETVNADVNGQATSSIFTANEISGVYNVTASATGLADITFSLTNDRDSARDIAVTRRVINNFMVNRANEIIADDFDIAARFDRNGTSAQDSRESFALTAEQGLLTSSFSTSLSSIRARMQAKHAEWEAETDTPFNILTPQKQVVHERKPQRLLAKTTRLAFTEEESDATVGLDQGKLTTFEERFDVWASGRFARVENGTNETKLLLLYFGADLKPTDKFLIGLSAQLDVASEKNGVQNTGAGGIGYLVGPYFAYEILPDVILDGRVAAGQSFNDVNPLGLGDNDFQTTRILSRLGITGTFREKAFTFRPNAQLIYFGEQQKAFVDNLGNTIPNQSIDIGSLVIDPHLRYDFSLPDGLNLSPFLSAKGIWDFASAHTVDVQTGIATETTNGPRLRLEGGVGLQTTDGITIDLQGFYDGIGQNDFEAYGGNLALRIPF